MLPKHMYSMWTWRALFYSVHVSLIISHLSLFHFFPFSAAKESDVIPLFKWHVNDTSNNKGEN